MGALQDTHAAALAARRGRTLAPKLFVETPVDRVSEHLLAAPGLAEDTKARIRDLGSAYEVQRDGLRAAVFRESVRLARRLRAARRDAAERGEPAPATDPSDHPAVEELTSLLELELRTLDALDALLPPDARDRLNPEARFLLDWRRRS